MKVVLGAVLRLELRSLNQLKGKHWGTWKRLKRDAAEALLEARIRARRAPPTTKQRLIVTRYLAAGQRPFDHENLAAGAKGLVDALTDLQFWRDDSERYLEREYRQLRPPPGDPWVARGQLTMIAIQDLEEPV